MRVGIRGGRNPQKGLISLKHSRHAEFYYYKLLELQSPKGADAAATG